MELTYKYKVHGVVAVGNRAYRWGIAKEADHIEGQKASNSTPTTLKFIDIWKKGTDGVWRIYRDSSEVDTPPSLINGLNDCLARQEGSIALPAATLNEYVGHYELAPSQIFKVGEMDDKLYIGLGGQLPLQVFAKAKDQFFAPAAKAEFKFVRDSAGHVTAVTFRQGRASQRSPKISH